MATLINQQTDKISQQPENLENRNGPDFVQAYRGLDITSFNISFEIKLCKKMTI
jgi:hypothetical protein